MLSFHAAALARSKAISLTGWLPLITLKAVNVQSMHFYERNPTGRQSRLPHGCLRSGIDTRNPVHFMHNPLLAAAVPYSKFLCLYPGYLRQFPSQTVMAVGVNFWSCSSWLHESGERRYMKGAICWRVLCKSEKFLYKLLHCWDDAFPPHLMWLEFILKGHPIQFITTLRLPLSDEDLS